MTTIYQGSFSGGELDPSLHGRVDLDRYPLSLKTCRNYIVLPNGGLKNRGGTRFIAETKDSTKTSRLVPFTYSVDESYMLEFGDYYMRVIKNGAQVMSGRVPVFSTQRVVIGTATGSASGDTFTLPYPGVSNVDLVFADAGVCTFTTAQVGGYTVITLTSSTFPAGQPVMWAGDYDGTSIPYEIATPWSEAQVHEIQFCQSADVLFVVHPQIRPKRVERLNKDSITWRIIDAPFKLGPWQDINTDEIVRVFSSGYTKGSVVTLESPDKAIFSQDNLGQLFYLEAENYAKPWEQGKAATANTTVVRSDGKYYIARTTGTTGTLRPSHDSGKWDDGGVTWEYLNSSFGVVLLSSDPADILDSGRKMKGTVVAGLPTTEVYANSSLGTTYSVTASSSDADVILTSGSAHGYGTAGTQVLISWTLNIGSGHYAFTDTATVVDNYAVRIPDGRIKLINQVGWWASPNGATGSMTAQPASTGNGSYLWTFGAWSDRLGWPSCVTFYQQRLVYAASPSFPQTFWMSRIDSFDDFGMSNPVMGDDAINFTVVSGQLNKIESMMSMSRLLMLTAGGVWLVTSGQETAITPTTIGIEMQGFDGASSLKPIGIGNSGLFVQAKGQVVSDLMWELANENYNSNDVTVMAAHLLRGHTIKEWAYQRHPFRVVWMVREDGVLLGMTYMREQRVVGWHRHDTDGKFESVACVSESTEDALYVIVNRTIDGVTKRYIERFADRLHEDFFVDCGADFNIGATYHTEPIQIVNSAYDIVDGQPMFLPADWTNGAYLYLYSEAFTFNSGHNGKTVVFKTADGATYSLLINGIIDAHTVSVGVIGDATNPVVLPPSIVLNYFKYDGGPSTFFLDNPIKHWSFSDDTFVFGGGTMEVMDETEMIGPGLFKHTYTARFSTYTVVASDIGRQVSLMHMGVRYDYRIAGTGAPGSFVALDPVSPFLTSITATTEWFMSSGSAVLPWLKGKGVWMASPDSESMGVVDATTGAAPVGDVPSVSVGLPYVSDFETLDITMPQVNLRHRRKLTPNVKFLIDESRTLLVGSSFEQLFPTSINLTETFDALTGEMTGVCEASITSTWGSKGRVCSRHNRPRAMTILAVMPEVESE